MASVISQRYAKMTNPSRRFVYDVAQSSLEGGRPSHFVALYSMNSLCRLHPFVCSVEATGNLQVMLASTPHHLLHTTSNVQQNHFTKFYFRQHIKKFRLSLRGSIYSRYLLPFSADVFWLDIRSCLVFSDLHVWLFLHLSSLFIISHNARHTFEKILLAELFVFISV